MEKSCLRCKYYGYTINDKPACNIINETKELIS